MSEQPDNLILAMLRKLDSKVDRVIEDIGDLKRRTSAVEDRLTRVQAEVTSIHGDFAGQSMRIDRLETRLEKIERRLEIGDA